MLSDVPMGPGTPSCARHTHRVPTPLALSTIPTGSDTTMDLGTLFSTRCRPRTRTPCLSFENPPGVGSVTDPNLSSGHHPYKTRAPFPPSDTPSVSQTPEVEIPRDPVT